MTAIPTVVITAIATALLAAGGYAVGHKQGAAVCAADWQAKELASNQAWQQAQQRQQAHADELQRQLAQAQTNTRIRYKEILREIPAATSGRPCLGADALSVLDRFQSGTAPSLRLSATASESAGATDAVASDTQIAQWALDAIEQHERERARCNALIEWHRQP